MMRKYTPKDNVQKQSYYSNRFRVEPSIPKESPEADSDFESLKSNFDIVDGYIQRGQLVVYIDPKDVFAVVKFMRDNLDYNQLSEMSAIDWIAQRGGFEVFYQLLSMKKAKRVRIKTFINDGDAVESVSSIFNSARWSEREMFDMFGIIVNNHPNLKRMLLPEDWVGHPLRKTYPLQGDENSQWYEIDLIYGKEYRELFGKELRDAAYIDRYDTTRFARLGKEVPFGEKTDEKDTAIAYQEGCNILVKKMDTTTANQVTLEERR